MNQGKMVRPEGFEPPTLWFEAKCSIQLSYGRVLCSRVMAKCRAGKLGRWGGIGGGRRGRRKHGQSFHDVEAGAAEELVDDRFGEARGVVLNANSGGAFVQVQLADSVDLAEVAECYCGGFGGRSAVSVEDIELRHGVMIAARSLALSCCGV